MQQSQPIGQGTGQGFVIDPATITEWTAGLRCVNKIAVQNRDFAAAIKRVSFQLSVTLFPSIFRLSKCANHLFRRFCHGEVSS